MALLFIDGFDTYGTANGSNATANTIDSKYHADDVSGANCVIQAGRSGAGHSLELTGSTTRIIRTNLGTTNANLVVGFGLYLNSLSATAVPIDFRTDDTWGINLEVQTDGTVEVRNFVTVLGTTANSIVSVNTWVYLELQVECGNSGSYELWADGVSELSGSSVDTQRHASKSYHNAISFSGGTANMRIDDLYVLDGTGSTNNTALGIMTIETIYPDGDDTANWTANGGGSHYVEVDEAIFDEDTTYIESNTSAQQDIFTYGNSSNSGPVKGVQVTTDCKETDFESYQLKTLSDNGSLETSATQFVGTVEYLGKSVIFETDPSSANWTQATVNSNMFGVEVA